MGHWGIGGQDFSLISLNEPPLLSGGPIEEFLSLCELAMNLSSHQIIVSLKESSSSDMPVNLILIFFQVHQNI